MACHCLTTQDQDPKESINLSPEPDPRLESNPQLCGTANCKVSKKNIYEIFPSLRILPRPEPNSTKEEIHNTWLQEYDQWGALKCPCGQGYFCREHGSWISGEEVGSGVAATSDEQKQGSCPAYHYGDYADVTTYIGERDAVAV